MNQSIDSLIKIQQVKYSQKKENASITWKIEVDIYKFYDVKLKFNRNSNELKIAINRIYILATKIKEDFSYTFTLQTTIFQINKVGLNFNMVCENGRLINNDDPQNEQILKTLEIQSQKIRIFQTLLCKYQQKRNNVNFVQQVDSAYEILMSDMRSLSEKLTQKNLTQEQLFHINEKIDQIQMFRDVYFIEQRQDSAGQNINVMLYDQAIMKNDQDDNNTLFDQYYSYINYENSEDELSDIQGQNKRSYLIL